MRYASHEHLGRVGIDLYLPFEPRNFSSNCLAAKIFQLAQWLTKSRFDRPWSAAQPVIRSEIRSRAELNCALPLFLHPSHRRDTAHRPIGTGQLRARGRFGYWGEQIGHLRDQSGHHFGARRQRYNFAEVCSGFKSVSDKRE